MYCFKSAIQNFWEFQKQQNNPTRESNQNKLRGIKPFSFKFKSKSTEWYILKHKFVKNFNSTSLAETCLMICIATLQKNNNHQKKLLNFKNFNFTTWHYRREKWLWFCLNNLQCCIRKDIDLHYRKICSKKFVLGWLAFHFPIILIFYISSKFV